MTEGTDLKKPGGHVWIDIKWSDQNLENSLYNYYYTIQ